MIVLKKKSAILLSFVIFSVSPLLMATPNISSVVRISGTPDRLVISGSNFTDKSVASPLFHFDFENDSVSQTNYSTSTKEIRTNGTLTSETSPTNEGYVLRYRVVDDYRAIAIPKLEMTPPPDRLYVYFHRRYNFSIDDPETWGPRGLNLKVNRFWGQDGNNIYIGYQGSEGTRSGRIFAEYTASGGATWTGSNLPQVKDTWNQNEIIYQASDIDRENGRFDVIRNGNVASSALHRMRTSSRPSKYSEFYFDQISNGVNDSKNLYIYYDNIYIDNVFNRVFLSDSDNFSDAKTKLIQVPTEWRNDKIEVILNTGNFKENEAFIYIVDTNGVANEKGFKICDSDCPVPPSPPESIRAD